MTDFISQIGLGLGTLLAGTGIGVVKVLSYVESKKKNGNGKSFCGSHYDLQESVALIANDVKWLRQKHEESNFTEFTSALKLLSEKIDKNRII